MEHHQTASHAFGTCPDHPRQYQGMITQSLYLPMRDGVKIAVDVTLPQGLPPGTRIPALLTLTRYWRAMELRAPFRWFLKAENLNPHFKDFKPFFTGRGYALVSVDVRGTGASFGVWPYPWAKDSIRDAAEIVDWIVAQPWSNGRVGSHGISYLGTTAELLPVTNHPAVKAVIPMFNHPDAYIDIAFPGGVLNERFIKDWGRFDKLLDQNTLPSEFGLLGRLVIQGVKPVAGSDGRQLLQEAVRSHARNGDVYQMAQKVTFRDQVHPDVQASLEEMAVHQHRDAIERSQAAIFGWGSWMDAGTADAVLRRFMTYSQAQRAVIGAWEHGGRFHASPYQNPGAPVSPSLPDQWKEMARFFDAYLMDQENGVREEKVLFYYTMGEEKWKRTEAWPPKGCHTERWYLRENHSLSPEPPAEASGADSYRVDFQASTGDHNRWWEMGGIMDMTVSYPDRAEAEPHLLSYTSAPLDQDTEITGYPVVALWVTSSETDGLFCVYLEDVSPEGRVTYLTEGQLRALHRKVSAEEPPYHLSAPYHSFKEADAMPLIPGEMAELHFGLLPTSVLIRRGHRIRVSIAGHDQGTFPRTPAEGNPLIQAARNRAAASYIDLPVIQRAY